MYISNEIDFITKEHLAINHEGEFESVIVEILHVVLLHTLLVKYIDHSVQKKRYLWKGLTNS